EVGKGLKGITTTNGTRVSDRIVVMKKVRANANRVRSSLIREVINNLVQLVDASGWRARLPAENGNPRNVYSWTDKIRRRSGQIAMCELPTRLIDESR